ncbi:heavy metal-binding protein HIP-like [Mya arenaria]|uniref:heavy metal-binding protein HIP-like n=1 Tax=Mya arenaria TaxID=6604 RepID=UPI0022E34A46|nr:heavy metal-binding protein HIP-like [Mya arenaria]
MENSELLSLLCVASLTLLVHAAPSRSVTDDIAILKERIDRQTLALTTLRAKVGDLEQSFSQSLSLTSQFIEDVTQQLTARSTSVAFFARLDKSYENIGAWVTIVFKTVVTNEGGAYDGTTGVFTAPVNGTYVFNSNIMAKAGKSIETSLKVNDINKLYLYSGGTASFYGPGSNMAVLNLNSGDKVKMVKHGPWGLEPFYIHATWSTFSGFLLKPSL